jgi:hypothetical protein
MGRARGMNAASVSGFDAVMGRTRGTIESALFETQETPSAGGQRLLTRYEGQLQAGQLVEVQRILQEYFSDINRLPRLLQLRFLYAEHMAMSKSNQHYLLQKRTGYLFSIKPGTSVQSSIDHEMRRWTALGFTKAPSQKDDAAAELPDEVYYDMMADSGFVHGLAIGLAAEVCQGSSYVPEEYLQIMLGPGAYQRLSQEAAGQWSKEMPLSEVFLWEGDVDARQGKELRYFVSKQALTTIIRNHLRKNSEVFSSYFDKQGRLHPAEFSFKTDKEQLQWEAKKALATLVRRQSRKGSTILTTSRP